MTRWCLIYSDSTNSPFWMLMTVDSDRDRVMQRYQTERAQHPDWLFSVQSVSADLYNAIVKSTVKAMR